MRKVFEILPSSIDTEDCILLCEVSNEGFAYTIKEEAQNSFKGLAVYHFEKITPPVGFPIALQILFHQHEILSKKFKKTIINNSFPSSVLIPFSLYNSQENGNVLNLMYGDLRDNDTVLTDIITQQGVYNSFRIPAAIHDVIQTQFPDAKNVHQYTVLLNQPVPEKNKLFIIFYSKKIVVLLAKDGKYQLVNSFNYDKAEDVTYTLLNICQQFDVKNIDLHISGLLEQNSALYKEIYKYFNSIELATLPGDKNYSEEILQFPSHYFSHIFAIDSCE